jgi:hypothetical protein
MGRVKEFYCMIYTIKLCNMTIHYVRSKKKCLCPNNILYQRYNISFFDDLSITRYNKFCQIRDLSFRGWHLRIELNANQRGGWQPLPNPITLQQSTLLQQTTLLLLPVALQNAAVSSMVPLLMQPKKHNRIKPARRSCHAPCHR